MRALLLKFLKLIIISFISKLHIHVNCNSKWICDIKTIILTSTVMTYHSQNHRRSLFFLPSLLHFPCSCQPWVQLLHSDNQDNHFSALHHHHHADGHHYPAPNRGLDETETPFCHHRRRWPILSFSCDQLAVKSNKNSLNVIFHSYFCKERS